MGGPPDAGLPLWLRLAWHGANGFDHVPLVCYKGSDCWSRLRLSTRVCRAVAIAQTTGSATLTIQALLAEGMGSLLCSTHLACGCRLLRLLRQVAYVRTPA